MGKLRGMPPRVGGMAARVAAPAKTADSFYLSGEWRTLISDIKAARGAWCEDCGAGGRLFGDHIQEIRDGGALLDPKNIKLRCGGCHARKTAKAKAARARGEMYREGG